MNRQDYTSITSNQPSVLATNKVLKNTYLLLGATFLFSGLMATIAIVTNMPPMNLFIVIIGYYGLLFLTSATQNSPMGIISVFALTGFMGLTLGPMINFYLTNFSNGGQIVATALGGTGIIFFGLSGYALTTQKDFSYMQGFLFAGILIAVLAAIANIFFQIPALSLIISSVFILLFSGVILWQTSEIIHGGERNYIAATVTLFVSLYQIFANLLQILGALSGRD